MKDEYIIINKSSIEKKIEKLKHTLRFSDKHECEIVTLQEILSQSTPLIPEIEKAYQNGFDYYSELQWDIEKGYGDKGTVRGLNKQEYVSNLKLDI